MICPPVRVTILAIVLVAFIGARPVVAIRVLPAIVDLDFVMIKCNRDDNLIKHSRSIVAIDDL